MCTPSPEFMQLVAMMAAGMVAGRDLETMDVDLVAERAVELSKAIGRQIEKAMQHPEEI